MSIKVLVACPSKYRREWYRTELSAYGLEIEVVEKGIECVVPLLVMQPDAVVLESGLRWGGADGVLELIAENSQLDQIPIILIATDGTCSDIYRLAGYSLQGFFSHVPAADQLAKTIQQVIDDGKESPTTAATQACA